MKETIGVTSNELRLDLTCLLKFFSLQVGENTKPERIHCQCNHLTSFASDFVVAPNPIDFNKVFSADLSKNFVVLLVVCLLFGFYLLLVVIARRFDKKDLDKVRGHGSTMGLSTA